jgi:Zn-finger nucleic acid-binding protein
MNCTNCGAPLPAKSNLCRFCKTLNDTDLHRFTVNVQKGEETSLECPRCALGLHTVELSLGQGYEIERCQKCLGLFFDPSELDALLESAVSSVYEIDQLRIQTLLDEEVRPEEATSITYIPCPVCRQLMHRKGFGVRAGVIVDRCKEHGIWLDGGELSQLLKWVASGGRQLDEKHRELARKFELSRAKGPSPLSSVAAAEWDTTPPEYESLLINALRFVRYLFT